LGAAIAADPKNAPRPSKKPPVNRPETISRLKSRQSVTTLPTISDASSAPAFLPGLLHLGPGEIMPATSFLPLPKSLRRRAIGVLGLGLHFV
jgi:hypothetical protein